MLLSTLCWSASSPRFVTQQIVNRYDEVDLRVKAIGLGSTYVSVLRRWVVPFRASVKE